jgi:hypothetical protein
MIGSLGAGCSEGGREVERVSWGFHAFELGGGEESEMKAWFLR